jgi:AraC-like DNA-binding protein
MNATSPTHLSLSQVEHSLSQALVCKETTRLEIADSQLGKYSLHVEQYADFSVRKSHYHTAEAPLHLWARRNEPTLMMFFLLQGNLAVATKAWQRSFQTRQQLISLFPSCHSSVHLPSQTVLQDIIVKITPRMFQDVLVENDNPVTDFIYQTVAREESLPKAKGSLFIDATTYGILQSIHDCPYGGKMRELYLEAQTKLLLVHQLTVLTQAVLNQDLSDESKLTREDIEKLHELRLYLESNFLQEHTLQSLTQQFGLNLFKLKYGFKKLFGHSVMKWLDDKKLQYAHALLLSENASIFEVATQLNYQHPNNFSAAFKRKFGHSPHTLRMS